MVGSRVGGAVFPCGPEGGAMSIAPQSPAAMLARLTDDLALIVCAAHALRAAEEEVSTTDFIAEISALRQGIAAVQRAASDLGLSLAVPSIAESACSADQ